MWRAIAFRWTGALVDPPIAELTRIAFRNAARVMMSDGRRLVRTISTIRLPVSHAHSCRSRYGAGIAAEPGNDIPSASASEFIVVAVPNQLQSPVHADQHHTRTTQPRQSHSPAAR